MATDPKYLVDTKNPNGTNLYILQQIGKQAGVKDYDKLSSTQLVSAIKQNTGTSGNTFGNTIGNKTLNQYGYKVDAKTGNIVPTQQTIANNAVASSVAFVPGFGSMEFKPGSEIYNYANSQYNNYLQNQELLNNSYNQYITTLNGGASGADAALDNARSNAIDQITRTYDDSARNYYRLYKRQEKDLPEQLSSVGATGGASESAALNLMNNYSDNLYKNEYGRNQQISGLNEDYYNAIAQNSQQLAQQIANAYLQLGNAQLDLNNSYNNSVNNVLQYMQQQKEAEADALSKQEQAKSAAALTSRNNRVRENEAERLRQGYTTMHWTDQDGQYHYQITGKKKVSNSKSGGSGGSKSGGSGGGNDDDKNKVDSASATDITNKLGAYLMGRPTLEPTEKQSLIANYLYGVVNKGAINQATAKQVLANLGYKEK